MYHFRRWLDRCIEYARALIDDPDRSDEERFEIESYLMALQEIREQLPSDEPVPSSDRFHTSELNAVKAWLERVVTTGSHAALAGGSKSSAARRRSAAYIQAARDARDFLERQESLA